jgi:hypothetical protein
VTESFVALLFAHALADFVLQTRWMAEGKHDREVGPFVVHILIVAIATALCLGAITPAALLSVLALTGVHLGIDLAKTAMPGRRLWPFLLDQALHLCSLGVLALLKPDLWAAGVWGGGLAGEASWAASLWSETPFSLPWLPSVMALGAGLVLTTRAGGFAVGLVMEPWSAAAPRHGLALGGRTIGWMERGLIFLLVMVGQPAGIGFLIAAKSILRYETTKESQGTGEYVIIGTLASFGWALLGSYATVALLAWLPPIGVPLG